MEQDPSDLNYFLNVAQIIWLSENIPTFYPVENFIVRLRHLIGGNIVDCFQLIMDGGGVEIRGEDDSLQLSEMTILHQPGCCLDVSQGPRSVVRPDFGGGSHLLGQFV